MLNKKVEKYITGYNILAREFTEQYEYYTDYYKEMTTLKQLSEDDKICLKLTSEELCEIMTLMIDYANKIIMTSILQIATLGDYAKCTNKIDYFKEQKEEYKRIKRNVELLTKMILEKK